MGVAYMKLPDIHAFVYFLNTYMGECICVCMWIYIYIYICIYIFFFLIKKIQSGF